MSRSHLHRRTFLAGAAAASVAGLAGIRPASAAGHELKIATVAPPRTPWADLLTEFKKTLETKSKGALKVRVFLGGTMGDENETVRMTARGQLSGVGASTGAVASLVEELAAIEIPFLFKSANEADYVLDKFLLTDMEERFKKKGLVLGFWSENGFRHFGASFPIKGPDDLKSKKMRSQESYVHIAMWEALQASAAAIPTTEVTTALKTGTVHGFDQALLYMVAGGWHQSIKHLTLSAHIYQPAVIAFNKGWFDGLPAELQKLVLDEGRAITRKGREAIRKMNPKLVDIVKKAGVINTVKGRGASTRQVVELIERGLADFKTRSKRP